MKHFRLVALLISLISLAAMVIALAAGFRAWIGPPLIAMFAALALFCMGHPTFKSYAFTVWVFAFVCASMAYPAAFMTWFGYDLKGTITPLIQIIMFGMGTHLALSDFARVLRTPWPVAIGFCSHFIIMPLCGFTLAKLFGFDPAIAAGVILIGSCPSGVASNVMTYLARGDVALAVTITSCSTLASPVMTPLLMKILAGDKINVNFLAMMFEIINMILVPIVAGLIANRILFGRHKAFDKAGPLVLLGAAAVLAALAVAFFAPTALLTVGKAAFPKGGLVIGLMLIGVVALAKLIIGVLLHGPRNWMDKALPLVSMAAICAIIAVITVRSRDDLLRVGPLLILATVIHNAVGYFAGYWMARAARLSESSCRAVAFEVGMQNGGMASGLAMGVLNSAPAALAPAIFGPWQNISGSILATWWHRRLPPPDPTGVPSADRTDYAAATK